MNQFVIIEKLKEAIGDKKVQAAVFYTYCFEAKFFENYILTVFLPHVNFSDNEIQNTILWRKYASELPDVTVYCDFHAKGNDAPNLDYVIRTIDLPAKDYKKACFHPKVSFILLEDYSCIVISGSNNLTVGGWCTNREIISIKTLKNGEDFPYHQKHQLWDFMNKVLEINDYKLSEAEVLIDGFFSQRKHTDSSDFHFFHSIKESFHSFLKRLLSNNNSEYFENAEIISPYLSPGTDLLKQLKALVNNNIYMLVPYKAMDEADITEENYKAYEETGVKWSKFIENECEKGFRFNHSKIYRLKTRDKLFTIVGSVNFTDAAWKGKNENGNVETAIVFEEPALEWKPWLQEYKNSYIVFTQKQEDETIREVRTDAPDLQFRLNWAEKTLKYTNSPKYKFNGQVVFSNVNKELRTGTNIIELDDSLINELANNPIIKVWQYHVKKELLYYPIQQGIESKPLPFKLRLKDNEIIELWNHISLKEENKSEITELIEKYIYYRLDKEGDISKDADKVKSTINMISSHISALIRLEERIFTPPRLKGEYKKAKEIFDYYLFTENIDTLSGYCKLLQDMYADKLILPGVYWFLLNLLFERFYNSQKIRKYYREIEISSSAFTSERSNIYTENIIKQINILKGELKSNGVDMDLLKWINTNL